MDSRQPIAEWILGHIPFSEAYLATEDPVLLQWGDLGAREEKAGIRPGQYFLLPRNSFPDPDVVAFFRYSELNYKSRSTQRSYANDIRVFLSFLGLRQKPWRDATTEDVDDFEFWRRRDSRNPQRVSDSKFNREIAACRLFYEFQVHRGALEKSPFRLQKYKRWDGSIGLAPAVRAKARARNNVKWLTPSAYVTWRRVGLEGYGPDGLPDDTWRGRNDGRNAAFVDLLWSSGLRVSEAATLLLPELPRRTSPKRYFSSRLAKGTAKGGAGRHFWVSAQALREIESYVTTTRQEAIDRARTEGRYERLPGVITAISLSGKRAVRIGTRTGKVGRASFDQLEPHERERLFIETEEGLEPMALWLNDAGLPLKRTSWHAVFATANERVAGFNIGTEAGPLYCRPHMLRHSFALRMLVTLQNVWDRRLEVTSGQRDEYYRIFGDPMILVAQLLGHASIDTTRNIYLEPANGLRLDAILNEDGSDAGDIARLLAELASETLLIHDAPATGVNDGGDDG